MSDQPELTPCPKCGFENIETPTYFIEENEWGVQCLSCGHEMGGAIDMDDARKKWNARATETAA